MGSPLLNGIECAKLVDAVSDQSQRRESEMKVTRIGLDIAKEVFEVHGVNEQGKAVVRRQLRRARVLEMGDESSRGSVIHTQTLRA